MNLKHVRQQTPTKYLASSWQFSGCILHRRFHMWPLELEMVCLQVWPSSRRSLNCQLIGSSIRDTHANQHSSHKQLTLWVDDSWCDSIPAVAIIYKVFIHPRWLGMGFLNHQQDPPGSFKATHSLFGGGNFPLSMGINTLPQGCISYGFIMEKLLVT